LRDYFWFDRPMTATACKPDIDWPSVRPAFCDGLGTMRHCSWQFLVSRGSRYRQMCRC